MANPFDQFDGQNVFDQFDTAKPSIAKDVLTRGIPGGIADLVQGTIEGPPRALGWLGRGAQALGIGNPEANAKQAAFDEYLKNQPQFSLSNLVPQPETTTGQYTRGVIPYAAGAAGLRGSIARNVAGGVGAGLAGETASQVGAGPVGQIAAATLGGFGGLKAAESVASRVGAARSVGQQELKNVADAQYEQIRNNTVPIPQEALDRVADSAERRLHIQGHRSASTSDVRGAVEKIRNPSIEGAPDIADLVASRNDVRSYLGQVGADGKPTPNVAAAREALPFIEREIEKLSPGTTAALQEADKNYSAYKASAALDRKQAIADLRASGENSGLNYGNKIRQNVTNLLLSDQAKYLSDANKQALKRVVKGTGTSNVLRGIGNALGGGGGIGATIVGTAGLTGAGGYFEHPELGLAPLAGIGLRVAGNRIMAQRLANAQAFIRSQSPYQKSLGILGPQLSMRDRDAFRQAGLLGLVGRPQ